MSRIFVFLALAAAWGQAPLSIDSIHYIRPADDPQAAIDAANPGDKLVFLPGLHQHPLRKHQSILYVDKSIDIELMEGSVLKLADGQTVLEREPEITIDHGAAKTLNDLSAGGTYDLGLGRVFFTIRIDGEGGGNADTFEWDVNKVSGLTHHHVPITGNWQPLSNGVEIRFDSTTGHSLGSLWMISYDGRESYGIRIGHGTQRDYIENVRIYGKGTIDMNYANNAQPTELVKNISACVLIHGRVRNVLVEGITMTNTMRSVMAYGEQTGKFLRGGGTEGGESFDAENITVVRTRTINPVDKGYLFGHPSHRGRISNVRCNYNYMVTGTTALEPNFNLSQYEVIGNVIQSGGRAIHCWRKSTNGLIKNNVRINDTTGLEVVMVNSPGAWEDPENLIIRDNRNHLSDPIGYWANVSGGFENRALGAYSTVSGGRRNIAEGRGATVTGGEGNQADGPYSLAHGIGARSTRAGEDVLASGAFDQPGDAQASRLVAKALTTDNSPQALRLAGDAPIRLPVNATVSYRILVAATAEHGQNQAAFEALGLARSDAAGGIALFGNRTSVIHKSDAAMNFEVVANSREQALELRATGPVNTRMRWVAEVDLVEVHF